MLSITALSIKYRTFTKPATADTMPSTDMLKRVLSTLLLFNDYLSDTTITTLFSLNSQPVRFFAYIFTFLNSLQWENENGKLLDTQYKKQTVIKWIIVVAAW